MSLVLEILVVFIKVGALTFGGGYAMLPILQREVVERRHWVTEEEVMDFYAVSQCLPGIIAVNTASFVGRKVGGKKGCIAAAAGVVIPSFLIITCIAAFLQNFLEYTTVQRAFSGIRVAVCALVVDSIVKMWKKSIKDVIAAGLFLIVFAATTFGGISTIPIVIFSMLFGIVVKGCMQRRNKE